MSPANQTVHPPHLTGVNKQRPWPPPFGETMKITSIGRIGKASLGIASAAVAAAALGACTPTPGAPAGVSGSAPVVHQAPLFTGPTANLTKLANAITDHEQSLSTEIDAPASLGLPASVGITVAYSSNDVDFTTAPAQSYNNSIGNEFHYNFAANTYPRFTTFGVDLKVTLTDKISSTNTKTFSFTLVRTIHPLYDVSISPLTIDLKSEPTVAGQGLVQWRDPSGVAQQTYLIVNAANSRQDVYGFAREYRSIPLSGYELPTASYFYAGVTDTRPYPTAEVAAPPNVQSLFSGSTDASTIKYTLHNPRYDTSTYYNLNLSYTVTRHPVLYSHPR
jgi:hypothetical protein